MKYEIDKEDINFKVGLIVKSTKLYFSNDVELKWDNINFKLEFDGLNERFTFDSERPSNILNLIPFFSALQRGSRSPEKHQDAAQPGRKVDKKERTGKAQSKVVIQISPDFVWKLGCHWNVLWTLFLFLHNKIMLCLKFNL